MREVKQIYSFATSGASGVTTPVVMDQYISPFNVGLGIFPSGTATYTVQHTFDNPFDPDFNPATANWLNHPDLTADSGNNDGNYAFAVRAIRLNVSSTTADITFYVAQSGIGS